jgi:mannose-6-phosphate isomerase-like protein (cupin superfamily)
MSASRPVVVHPGEATAGPTTPGMEIRHYTDADDRWSGWSGWIRNDARDVSGWHHHAANETFVYVIRGSITVEFGSGGVESIEAHAGDFFHVPAATIHRETTGQDADLEAFVLRIGREPEYVDVDGPDGPGQQHRMSGTS